MFAPRTPCIRPNFAAFYPDRRDYTIDATSAIGWYVLFPPTAVNSPVLLYHDGSDRYLGYTTKPNRSPSTPLVSDDVQTGICNIIWLSIEDAANSQYSVESGVGTQMDTIQFTGRVVPDRFATLTNTAIDDWNQRMVYGYYTRDISYDNDAAIATTETFIDSTFVLTRLRHVPRSRLIDNRRFGMAVNLTLTEIGSDRAQPTRTEPIAAIETIEPLTYTVAIGSVRSLTLTIAAEAADRALTVDFGGILVDSALGSTGELTYRSTSIVVTVPLGGSTVTLDYPIVLTGRYNPIVRYREREYPIVGWLV